MVKTFVVMVVDNLLYSEDVNEGLEKPIPLDIDHINGDSSDNRLENLRILCKNCHALTDTYGWNGMRKKKQNTAGP